jgi:hypothetical protein
MGVAEGGASRFARAGVDDCLALVFDAPFFVEVLDEEVDDEEEIFISEALPPMATGTLIWCEFSFRVKYHAQPIPPAMHKRMKIPRSQVHRDIRVAPDWVL